jgi:hypothetical protein
MKQWEPAIRELSRVCKVGGWLEVNNYDLIKAKLIKMY